MNKKCNTCGWTNDPALENEMGHAVRSGYNLNGPMLYYWSNLNDCTPSQYRARWRAA